MIALFLFICALMLGAGSWVIWDLHRLNNKAKESINSNSQGND